VILYIRRWIKAPIEGEKGEIIKPVKGTPQGGVISPILANLYLHYALDAYIRKEMPRVQFSRYADDGILHCKSEKQAKYALGRIGKRLEACKLELHPEKTGIIYCKDTNRKGSYERIYFDYLGYRFMPRSSKNKSGAIFTGFQPGISPKAKQSISQAIRSWRIQMQTNRTIREIAARYGRELRGWYNYYGKFRPSEMERIWMEMNRYLVRWMLRKHKKLGGHKQRAWEYMGEMAGRNRELFLHWKLGVMPRAKIVGAV